MNQRKIGISISYINIGLHAIIGFLYVPILLHYVEKNEYGLYQLIGSLIAYFTIMDFGLTAAVTRFYSKYKAIQDKWGMENILFLSMYGYGIVTIVSLAIGIVCYFYLDSIFGQTMDFVEIKEAKAMFLLLLFNIAVTLSTMGFRAVINAYEKFLFLKGLEMIQLVIQPILVVIVLQGYPTAFSVALVQTVLNILLICARIYYCFAELHIVIKFHYWNTELFADFKKLALSVFVVALIDQIFWRTNQVILGVISGTEAVAVYSISSLIYMNYMALSTAISGVYLPHVTSLVAQKAPIQKLSDLFIQIGRWQYYLLALVFTGIIIFGQRFIELWAGKSFSEAYWITLLIVIPFTIDLIQNIGLSILQAKNKYGFRAKVYLGMGICNILLAVPLGIQYGGTGCAFATGLCMFIGNGIIMNWYYCFSINLDIKSFWKNIWKISVVILLCLGVGYMVNELISYNGILALSAKIGAYSVFYFSMIWFFAMSDYEKGSVKNILTKFIL